MKLTRAIEIMETKPPESASISDEDEEKAANLAIQAMKRFRNLRAAGHYVGMPLLKGETSEDTIRH